MTGDKSRDFVRKFLYKKVINVSGLLQPIDGICDHRNWNSQQRIVLGMD